MRASLLPPLVLTCCLLLLPKAANAKDYGVRSPGGRNIYGPNDQFGAAVDSDTRRYVVEVACGVGPEGNLGILLGWLNQPIKGLEWYAGAGFEANPAMHYTGAARYVMNFDGYRPYLATGYLFVDLHRLGTYSHNVFFEAGYKWVLERTHHLTLGIGVRRILDIRVRDSSVLAEPDTDRELLDEQLHDVYPWVPTAALRFSRAF